MSKESKQDAKVAELTADIKRIQAEFENYKKRVECDHEDFKKYASSEVIKDILPVLDNFELALQNCKDQEQFIKGMELVYSSLLQTLEDKGLQKIKTEGKFDPHLHEALLTEESDKPSGTILQELQKGFTINDRVIRHAKVKLAR